VEKGPIGLNFLFWLFPKCLHYCISIAHKVSNTLPAFPNGSQIPLRHSPKGLQHHINGYFLFVFQKEQFSDLYSFKIKETKENLKTSSCLSFLFVLSNQPLKAKSKLVRQSLKKHSGDRNLSTVSYVRKNRNEKMAEIFQKHD
jgi:hypothetical protein